MLIYEHILSKVVTMFHMLTQHLEFLQNNRNTILNMWMEYEVVQKKLRQNKMDVTFFKEKFATKVLEFAISVVKNENKTGDCPVIGVMLILFKKKNIPLSDVFIICVHLKNALLHFFMKHNILSQETLTEISFLMDYNFEGVINEYVLIYYNDSNIHTEINVHTLQKNSSIQTPLISEKKTTTAELYLQEVTVDMDAIAELNDLESDTLDAIDAQESINQNVLNEAGNLFHRYANVLNNMLEFEELAYTLTLLSELLLSVEFTKLTQETKYMLDIYLKAIISDLQNWRISIFITREAKHIHYLDKTLLSSIAQIQMTLMPQEENGEENIEFF